MTAQTVDIKSCFQAAFPAFEAARGDEAAWLTRARRDAIARFAEQGLPTRGDEAWKYTDVRPIAQTQFGPRPDADAGTAARIAGVALGGPRAVLVNGVYAAEHSDVTGLSGASVTSLRARPAALQATVSGRSIETAFSMLNTAFVEDGVVVSIAAGQRVTSPIELIVVTTASDQAFAAHPRLIVEVGANAEATLIETHVGPDGNVYLNNPVVDIRLGAGAILHHVRLVDEGSHAFHIALTRVEQPERDSRYSSVVLTFGGRIVRHDLSALLDAEGAHVDLDGLYLPRGEQRVDNHTTIDHAKPHTTSSERYKGVLADRSRGTFFGRILVRRDAQKISAEQQNRNLLLSDEALANSTPQLEIYADDVKCAHGSTVGQIDPNQLFYLRSRGLDAATARELLTYAFANEIIERVAFEPLRERLAQRLIADPELDPRSEP